ncbi:MAG: thioredoxin family protein [Bacteroidales bacterium]
MKKFFTWLFLGICILFFIFLFVFKNKLNNVASTLVYAQLGENEKQNVLVSVDSLFNYEKNKQSHQITFLEFGSTGCSACKRMEKVMEDIRQQYPDKVNVIFVNVTKKDNHDLLKFYGIAVIPTQVLLDKTGKEFFRHSGYISAKELITHFE